MRFNDLMQTVLAAQDRSGLGAVTLWRQCVDLLAQHDRHDRPPMPLQDRDALLDRLTALRPRLSETQRIATVVELGRRLRSPALVQFFAGDRPSIAAAATARADLPDRCWVDLLSRMTPTARGVLRGRRDIGAGVRQALEAFGPTDLVLTTVRPDLAGGSDMLLTADMMMPDHAAQAETPLGASLPHLPDTASVTPLRSPANDQDQIRNLVDRIARFTSTRRPADEAEAQQGRDQKRPEPALRAFAFETDASGVIVWIDQGPRAALIGLSVGEAAVEGASGPDGHVAGAFIRRSGFQNGRFMIVGGAGNGQWRMSAMPFFDPRSGRFQGYRGQARRPYLHEVAAQPQAETMAIAGLSADSLRQLVHELRTPLNAILGFAEIIEQELFGAAGPHYRDMAGKIAVDARHLLVAFDDLDLAAQVSHGDAAAISHILDPALLVSQVVARFQDQGAGDVAPIDIAMAHGLPPVRIDPVQGDRMVQHLLRMLISVTPVGETITGSCWFQPDGGQGRVVLAFDRPSSIAGLDEAQMLDPGYTPDGEWADGPLLGLGFSLRLIRNLATGCGGGLEVAERLLLTIPAANDAQDAVDHA